jgi:hypothetical protein
LFVRVRCSVCLVTLPLGVGVACALQVASHWF